jgi:hypothetical protein
VSEEPTAKPAKKSNWLAAVVIIAAVVAIYAVARRRPRATAPEQQHHHEDAGDPFAGMHAVQQAILNAPEGANDCETAWNAFDALEKGLKDHGQPSSVEKHPDRQTFLDVCAGFSDLEKKCLTPKFKDAYRDRCEPEGVRVWSEQDALKRKNLFTIFGRRDAPPMAPTNAQSPLTLDASGD